MEHKLTDAQREVALQKAREIPGFLWSEGCGFESGVVESELLDYVASVLAALPKPEPVAYADAFGNVITKVTKEFSSNVLTNDFNRPLYAEAPIQSTQGWQPIETAPKDNKRQLYLARLNENGELLELDFEGGWDFWQESWELPHINGWYWGSAHGIEEPTHWSYQEEPPPATNLQPAALADDARDSLLNAMQLAADQIRRCDYTPARSTLLTAIAAAKGEK